MNPADEQIYPWLQAQWEHLIQQQESGRLPHALLLSGPAGIGKAAFGTALAHLLLCHQPQNGRPCGHCRSCELIASGHHPDRSFLSPEEPGKPIRVDQVRELTTVLHSTAQQGGYRIMIMEPAEAMNVAAANALLKTLEEPGQDTLLILVCHQLGQLMPTIRSRCQRIEFSMPTAAESTPWLAQKLDMDEEAAGKLLAIAQGAPLAAVDMKQGNLLELRRTFMSGLADLIRDRTDAISLAQKLHKEELIHLLDWWLSLLSDLVRLQSGAENPDLNNVDMTKMLSAVAQRADRVRIFSLVDRVQSERKSLMLRYNPNRQLLLEKLMFDWRALVR
ncbi:DNA polymerase III subunit delta' [Marinobacterium lutimaris]|uniref:DNA polymerase III subunit delta' n=1 Tax=Marinobacterium lutimaris TaxID=568106 RepID=A0A1H5W041_9GAMM|nr:DNA polymerase III subunit delta' [Marinobacterium lutimaris]SEF92840.1 DNA polymerase III, delta prime subunit [Marinobacterium lutimaris]